MHAHPGSKIQYPLSGILLISKTFSKLNFKTTNMKKIFLQALLLLTSVAAFAQDQEQHSAEYNWGEKNAVYVIIGVVVLIIVIVYMVRSRKKKVP